MENENADCLPFTFVYFTEISAFFVFKPNKFWVDNYKPVGERLCGRSRLQLADIFECCPILNNMTDICCWS